MTGRETGGRSSSGLAAPDPDSGKTTWFPCKKVGPPPSGLSFNGRGRGGLGGGRGRVNPPPRDSRTGDQGLGTGWTVDQFLTLHALRHNPRRICYPHSFCRHAVGMPWIRHGSAMGPPWVPYWYAVGAPCVCHGRAMGIRWVCAIRALRMCQRCAMYVRCVGYVCDAMCVRRVPWTFDGHAVGMPFIRHGNAPHRNAMDTLRVCHGGAVPALRICNSTYVLCMCCVRATDVLCANHGRPRPCPGNAMGTLALCDGSAAGYAMDVPYMCHAMHVPWMCHAYAMYGHLSAMLPPCVRHGSATNLLRVCRRVSKSAAILPWLR